MVGLHAAIVVLVVLREREEGGGLAKAVQSCFVGMGRTCSMLMPSGKARAQWHDVRPVEGSMPYLC
jgi:hypothetical protein